MEKTSLYFKSDGSDKEYHVTLDGGSVIVQYGRRGSALTNLVKCENCAPDKALKVYQKLIAEKKAKGYHEGEAGIAYSPSVNPEYVGYQPQLLNEIDENTANHLLHDDDWLIQEKEDGRNIGIILKDGKAVAANKKGLQISIPEKIIQAIENTFNDNFTFCGELVGDTFKVWDLLEDYVELDKVRYIDRYRTLQVLVDRMKCDSIKATRTAVVQENKILLFNVLKESNSEGVVFKRKDSLYHPGRPASGGDQLKFKFTATCSVIAGEQNVGKRSVEMFLHDEKYKDENGRNPLVSVGNVTIYPNQEIPKVDSVCEIKYLYAFKGGSLFQPVFKCLRDDVSPDECTTSQLKYKRELEEE